MVNYWLSRRYKVGRRVRYKGPDINLDGKIGKIIGVHDEWFEVEFEIVTFMTVQTRAFSVDKNNLELA
jgi:hypothetical protein